MKTKAEYSEEAKVKLQWQLNYKGQYPLMMLLLIYLLTTNAKIADTPHDWIITICLVLSGIWAIISFTWKFPVEKLESYIDYLKAEDQRKETIQTLRDEINKAPDI